MSAMRKFRRVVNEILFGAEDRVETFLEDIESVCCSLTRRAVGFVFGVAEVAVEETFGLVHAVVDAVLGRTSDDDIIDKYLAESDGFPSDEDARLFAGEEALEEEENPYCTGPDGVCPVDAEQDDVFIGQLDIVDEALTEQEEEN